MSILNQRLKQLRNEKNLTQIDVVKDNNISERAYRYYETGEREPTSSTIIKLCEYFQVSADYLLGLSDVKELPPPPRTTQASLQGGTPLY
jgi:transcriptional regulator with XRE-family HTH domain